METNKLSSLSNHDLEMMSNSEKIKYFEDLREYCLSIGKNYKTNITTTQQIMAKVGFIFRNFDYEILGEEKLPKDGCIVMCNHSNTHDAFTCAEILYKMGVPTTFLAEIKGLSPVELFLFKSARSSMIDRTSRESSTVGLLDLSKKLCLGDTCVIFGEGTWNLHPFKPMQNIRIGGVKAAAISKKPIVPVIFEYVEVPNLVSKEKDLYSKCIVKVGEPIEIDPAISLVEQTKKIQSIMEFMRKEIWIETGTYRESIEDINPSIYVNHTWLKKYGTPLFDYDSEGENQLLFSKNNGLVENEYFIDENGIFRPGIIPKKQKVKSIY